MANLATDKSLNNSQWISIIGGLLFVVVSGSEIVWRFKTLETSYRSTQENIEVRLNAVEKRIEEVNSRIDRKVNPVELDIKELQKNHNK